MGVCREPRPSSQRQVKTVLKAECSKELGRTLAPGAEQEAILRHREPGRALRNVQTARGAVVLQAPTPPRAAPGGPGKAVIFAAG